MAGYDLYVAYMPQHDVNVSESTDVKDLRAAQGLLLNHSIWLEVAQVFMVRDETSVPCASYRMIAAPAINTAEISNY